MINPQLLEILRCPATRMRLCAADDKLLAALKAAAASGSLRTTGGSPLGKELDGALVREDGALAYAVVDGIPRLLVDEAILLAPFADSGDSRQP
jgi:uncharacterized protein YbaR (Trm112 family)